MGEDVSLTLNAANGKTKVVFDLGRNDNLSKFNDTYQSTFIFIVKDIVEAGLMTVAITFDSGSGSW